jgi:DeoR/GlpR family transcriptional regulator of sugar metabolism
MDTKRRRLEMLEILEAGGELKIAELSPRFSISEMTVRRDLEVLEREGILKRVRGGAISAISRSYEPPFALRAGRNAGAKKLIGETVAQMISDGETVIIDVGTTALAVAEALSDRRSLTIVTPSLRAAWLLADNAELRVMVTGGTVRPMERSLVGPLSDKAFENLYCDTYIMGIGGIDVDAGFTEFNLDDARVKQEAMRYSQRCVAVADATKLGRVAFARVAGLEQVDALVTDGGADAEKVAELREAGLEVTAV